MLHAHPYVEWLYKVGSEVYAQIIGSVPVTYSKNSEQFADL